MEQREEAIALRETFGQVAKDISSKAGDFHDVTADTASQGAHALADTDSEFGGKLNNLGNNPDSTRTPRPTEPPTTPGSSGGTPSPGSIDDNFQGGEQGGQRSEGNSETPACKDPVDPVSGQMMTSATDLALPGILPLILRRAYASGYRHGQLFGPGWSSTLDERLIIDDNGIHYLGEDAQTLNYPVPTQPGQQVLPAAGARWPLTWDRKLDAIEILDPATGTTRHFPPPPHDHTDERRQIRHLTRITDRNDNWLTITRDTDAVPTQIDHVGGYRVYVDSSYHTDAFRINALRLADPTDPTRPGDDPLVGYGYDPAGRLVQILNALGEPLTYEYDHDDRITAWIDRLGYRYEYAYDEHGRIARVGGQDGALFANFSYDRDARCTSVVGGSGETTTYWYDEHDHVTKVVDPAGNATATVRDRYGRFVEGTDPLGNVTRAVRDSAGHVTELHRPDGTRILAEYNEFGLPVRLVAPSGAVTSIAYDDRGNLTAATDPLDATTLYSYDEHGGLLATTDPLGNRTTFTLDRAGLAMEVTDPLGAVWRAVRNARGQVVRLEDPLGNLTATEYDDEGRETARTYPDGSCESWAYDAAGNLIRHVNQGGFTTGFEYGSFREIRARIDPDGARYGFAYDRELRLTAVTNPLGARWTYEYDLSGNLVAERDFNGRTLTYAHDGAGRLVQRVNGAGQQTVFVRDECGRTVQQQSDGQVAVFSYDADGNLAGAENNDARVAFTRDAAGRITAETVNGRRLTTDYDAAGNILARTTPSGRTSQWQYDAAGNVQWLIAGTQRISFGHDAAGRETHRWLGPDIALTSEWDRLGRLTTSRLMAVTGPEDARTAHVLHHRDWTYRADGNPESSTDSREGERRFNLDPLGRPTAVIAAGWTEQYAYDAIGNITRAEDSRVPESAVTGEREVTGTLLHRAGRTRYEYDAQGRLVKTIRRTLSGGRRTWTYTYDAHDRMVEALTADGARWSYRYDPLGRRVAKNRLETDGTVAEETRFTWDGALLVEQEHTRAAEAHTAVLGWDHKPGSWTPLGQHQWAIPADTSREQTDVQFHAIVADLVGTPTELVAADGSIVWSRTTGSWGSALTTSSPAHAHCPLRFPGQYRDAETGLDYNFQRYYDPDTGRYTTADPLGLAPAPNDHAYVDNPLTWLDVLGLAPSIWSSTGSKTGPQNALGHWSKHKAEFPHLNNANEYVNHANSFLNSTDPGVQTKTRPNGDVIRFNPATDEFGVMKADGTPKTYFKPDPAKHGFPTNQDYFCAQ